MADLRSRFIEDYAGGLLNVARQELSTTGEVLVQDGFTSEGTLFVEDGSGTKSGLKLGVSLAEVVDPTTETGAVNVRYADRTYAKIRDLKIFSTAIASAQAALSDATSVSISNIETTLQILEGDFDSLNQGVFQLLENQNEKIDSFIEEQTTITDGLSLISEKLTENLQLLTTEFNSFKENTITELLKIEDLEESFDSFETEVSETLEDQDEKIETFIENQQSFREIQDQKIDSFVSSQSNLIDSLDQRIVTFIETELDGALDAQDTKISAQDTKINAQDAKINAQDTKIDAQDQKLTTQDQQISGFIQSQQNLIEALILRIDTLEAAITSP
jgi:hypothetical protein